MMINRLQFGIEEILAHTDHGAYIAIKICSRSSLKAGLLSIIRSILLAYFKCPEVAGPVWLARTKRQTSLPLPARVRFWKRGQFV